MAALGHERRFRNICVISAHGPRAVRSLASSANERRLLLAQILVLLAQIFADEILDQAERIFRAAGAPVVLHGFLLCRDLGFFPFRRCRDPDFLFLRHLFRDHHRPENLVTGLLIASDGDADAVGAGLQQVRIVARRVLPHAEGLRPGLGAGRNVFSSPVCIHAGDPRGERAGDAVIHDAGRGHRLGLAFGNSRELRVGLDGGQAVLAAVARDRVCHIVRVRQRGRDGHDDAQRDCPDTSPHPHQKTHRFPVIKKFIGAA